MGDDDSPIPPTPDLYTQILQKIAEISGNNGTVPDMSEYPKKDEIQKLIEQALENSETVIPSDYVTIEKLNDEILMIHESITPIRMDAHSHKNKDILDNTTASYTLEEQKKLAELNLSDYVTIRKLNDEILMVHEAITPIRLASHSHQNKELLDSFDADSLALLPDLQQFEDVTKYDIQTIKESLAPVVRQAHFHENLAVLDGITADRIKKWDSISTLQTQLNGLSTELTVWKNKCSSNSDRLHANEATIDNIISELDEIHEKINAVPNFDAVQETLKAMQAEIDSLGGNIQTIFQSGAGTLERHGDTIYTFYNNGYRSLDGFAQAYPNFCSAENDYALYYNQSDFSWAGTVYTMILKPFSISKNASIVITYQSGASAAGELYLMRKISGRTYAELAQVVYEQIQKGNVIKLDFQWVQSTDFISVLTDCTDIGIGDYYLAWKGVSDNTHAVSPDEAKIEAEVCISILKGKQFEFPVYFDLEEQKAFNTGKANCSAMVRAFCGELEKAGYWAGLYMSRSPFNSYMEDDIKTRYALWLAEYNSKLNYSGSVGMWQKSSTGRVSGISGNVDIDEGYIDYTEKVKSAGLNGFSKTKTISTPTAPIVTATETTESSVTVEVKVNGETYSGKLNKK